MLITLLFSIIGFKIGHLEPATAIKEPPEMAIFYGVGGLRVDPTVHALTVMG